MKKAGSICEGRRSDTGGCRTLQTFFVGGVSGDADEAVKAYLEGNLTYNPDVHCTHHDHEDGHSCGEHHCGEDKHGCAGNH